MTMQNAHNPRHASLAANQIRRLLITGSAVRVRPREPFFKGVFGWLAIWPVILLLGLSTISGSLHGKEPIEEGKFPPNLVWVCAYSDLEIRCFDTFFESPAIVDCYNEHPLTEYAGGSGVMLLTDAMGNIHTYRYGERTYQIRGGPANLDVIRLFPESWADGWPMADGFEGPRGCVLYSRH